MKITLNYAGNGDCILLETGNTSILVDGGTASSFSEWKDRVQSIEQLDCVIITHIDSDHVNGIIKLIESKSRPIINQVLYNGAEQILGFESLNVKSKDDIKLESLSLRLTPQSEEPTEVGVSEGSSLSYSLLTNEIPSNVNALHNGYSDAIKIRDLELLIIGPSQESLDKLKTEWEDVLDDEGVKRKILNRSHMQAFETYIKNLKESVHSEIADKTMTSINSLADFEYKRDGSLANETSLAFLVKDKSNSVLMLGDSHAETIISWLDKNNISKLEVDAVKISHHGSKNNINKKLIDRLDCNTYLISTNGKIFNHPDLESLAVIAKYSTKPDTRIIINNEISHINEIHIEQFYKYNKTELILNSKEIELV